MNSTIENSDSTVFSVDAEHGGLRISIVFIFVAIWVAIFVVVNTLIASDGVNILAMVISFAATALLTQQVEKLLKTRWPSGRAVRVEPNQISIVKRSQVQHEIDPSQRVNVLLWRFKIARRSRVPKGWYMVACALEQEDHYVPVYTFMSPADFDNLNAVQHFPLLQSRKELEKEGRENMRLAGEQRRLHTAENIRWMEGAEMTTDDFKQFITRLQEQFPQWMPSVI